MRYSTYIVVKNKGKTIQRKNLHLSSFASILHIYPRLLGQRWKMLTRELYKLLFFSLLVFILIMAKVMAQSTQVSALSNQANVTNLTNSHKKQEKAVENKNTLQAFANPAESKKPVLIWLSTMGTNAYQQSSRDNVNSWTNEVLFIKPVSQDRAWQFYLGYSSDMVDEEENSLTDLLVVHHWRRRGKLFGGDLGFNLGADLPIGTKSRKQNTKYGALAVAANLRGNLTSKLRYVFVTNFKKFFHTYKQTVNYKVNPEYRARGILTLTQNLSDRWQFSLETFATRLWSYEGTARDITYNHEEALGYALGEKMNYMLEVGHSSNGRFRNNEQGPDETFQFFSEKNSTYFLRFSATI